MKTRPPQPTSADIEAWRKLVLQVGRACDRIDGPMGDLASAADRARKAVMLGEISRNNACFRLVRDCQVFLAETLRGRRQLVETMLDRSVTVAGLVETASGPPAHTREREPRKDIFG